MLKLIYRIYKLYRFRYLSPSSGFFVFWCVLLLGDGDVEGGVVFRGSVGVVLGSLVQDLAGWDRWLNRGCRDWRRWCRRDRLDDGCQVGGPAAASPQEIAYPE